MEQFSSDVRMANGGANYFRDLSSSEERAIGELTFLDCVSGGGANLCTATYNTTGFNGFCRSSNDDYLNNKPMPTEATETRDRGVLILMENRNKAVLYTFLNDGGGSANYNVYRGEIDFSGLDRVTESNPFDIGSFDSEMKKMNGEESVSVQVKKIGRASCRERV